MGFDARCLFCWPFDKCAQDQLCEMNLTLCGARIDPRRERR
jgi:hypothetical protein